VSRDLDCPLWVVRVGDVHSAGLAVVIPERAGEPFDREPVESVGFELQLERAVVGLALVLDTEAEKIRQQLVVLDSAAGQLAEFVRVDIDDGHQ